MSVEPLWTFGDLIAATGAEASLSSPGTGEDGIRGGVSPPRMSGEGPAATSALAVGPSPSSAPSSRSDALHRRGAPSPVPGEGQ